ENIFLGAELGRFGIVDDETMTLRCQQLLARVRLDVSPDARVGDLGLGQQQLVEIARALNKQVRLLILDEPTSSLTERETEVLLSIINNLRDHGIACIYISHKLNEVKAISDTICVIRDGKPIATRPAAGLSEDDIITMMVGRELTALYPHQRHAIGDTVLRVEHLTAWHPVNRHVRRVNDVSFTLKRGEILGIAGLVGAGRTETVQCLFGVWPGRWQGDIWINDKKVQIRDCQQAIAQGIAMVPEDRKKDGIVPLMGVGKNITLAALDQFSRRFAPLDETREQHVINDAIARLRVKTSSPELPIGRLSGGNQQKAIIAKCLLLNPQILILDEPTRGI
ncbi:MAG TPA: D-xylose ABC transporter ATP-binding protein, partial [Pantoea sp.]|nr:D-xylose ABC transporter ATP-binding protein [Pantoea sp.]